MNGLILDDQERAVLVMGLALLLENCERSMSAEYLHKLASAEYLHKLAIKLVK